MTPAHDLSGHSIQEPRAGEESTTGDQTSRLTEPAADERESHTGINAHRLVIYLPALNEARTIKPVIEALPRKLDGVASIRMVVIDDGSTDETAAAARAAGAEVVSHGRNRGVGAAFHSAVRYALENGADILVGVDADGQFDPEEIPAMIGPILSGEADMVVGNRFAAGRPEHMSAIKYWGNKQVSNLISTVGGEKFRDVSCGFRAYSREALLRLNVFGEFTYTHETILSLLYQGLTVLDHPIKVTYHPGRESRVAGSIPRYAMRTSRIILQVMLDYRPLRLFGGFATVCMLIGLAFGLFLLGHYALTGEFTPYKATGFIGLGFLIFGVLVFWIALVADMLNRMRMNQERLLYYLKKVRYDGQAPSGDSLDETEEPAHL
jgi:glycosyltransferase involved in cell wall biosynthesis